MSSASAPGGFVVCVTGGAGFVGSHIVAALLLRADVARVVCTVSSLARSASSAAHLRALPGASAARLAFAEADLAAPDFGAAAFAAAFAGCDAVVHAASPYDLSVKTEDGNVQPALRGTEAALAAAVASPCVRRLVLTSSAAAVYATRLPLDHLYSEADFSDEGLLLQQRNFYALGKLRAERRAWQIVLREAPAARAAAGAPPLTMAAVCPTQCLGPALHLPADGSRALNTSLALLAELLDGAKSELPAKGKCLVDVREVAAAHVLALGLGGDGDGGSGSGSGSGAPPRLRTTATVTDARSGAQTAPERYLLVAGSLPWRSIADVLRGALPYVRVPTRVAPGPPSLPQALCSQLATHRLGVRHRPLEEAIADAARSIAASGYLNLPAVVARRAPTRLHHPGARLLALLAEAPGRRVVVAIAGVPGSGKSTLAARLRDECAAALRAQSAGAGAGAGAAAGGGDSVVVLGMDGFHLTRAQLDAMPDPAEAHTRRGAPWTFDAAGCAERLRAVRGGLGADAPVLWPSFDHAVKDPVENDIVVPASARLVIFEGLYALHPLDGFGALRTLFDEAWYLDTPPEESHRRLSARHQSAWGISEAEAERRIAVNDGINSVLVQRSSVLADALVL